MEKIGTRVTMDRNKGINCMRWKMKIIKWGQPKEEIRLDEIESLLESSFQPVEPRPEFKHRLHAQVLRQFQPVQEDVHLS